MPHRRKSKTGLIAELERSQQPVYVLDGHRKIAFANQACADWLETPREQFVGQTCNYHSRSDADLSQRITASLCPPPDAFAGNVCRGSVGGFLTDGPNNAGRIARLACFWPIAIDESTFLVMAVVDPTLGQSPQVSDSKQSNQCGAELHEALARWRVELSGVYRLDRIIGMSASMRAVQRGAKAAIASGADTLVVGPPGGGMEQLARAIHFSQYSPGNAPPLIPVDCFTGDAESLQSALRQVQTDRGRSAKGRLLLLQADRLNSHLLNELAGFVAIPHFDVGLLSTSETSLRELAERNEFDASLAHHLSTLEINLPPLSERIDDMALICQSLIEDFNAEGNRQLAGIDSEAVDLLCQYSWPRNMEELAQVIHAACLSATQTLIQPGDLPKQLQQGIAAGRVPRPSETSIDLTEFLHDIENELMRRALRVAKGNKAKAARMLGVSRQRMIRWSSLNQID